MASLHKLPPLVSLQQLLKIYGVSAQKQLSQNFLFNTKALMEIAESLGSLKEGLVVEIGPGPGSLTRCLLAKKPQALLAIEKDVRFQPILDQLALASNTLVTIYKDARNIGEITKQALSQQFPLLTVYDRVFIFGNLPFSVASPILIEIIDLLHTDNDGLISTSLASLDMAFMFQKEVAKKLVAKPRQKEYSKLSVVAQAYFEVSEGPVIPAQKFFPVPQVDGQMVLFRRKPISKLPQISRKEFQPMLNMLFGNRRKKLAALLEGKVDGARIEGLDISPGQRISHLPPEQIIQLLTCTQPASDR